MLLSLLIPTALAKSPEFPVSFGGVVGIGTAGGREFTTFSPMITGAAVWHTWFLEEWIGLSSTALLNADARSTWMAAPLQVEFGIGIGGDHLGFGLYNGYGFGGSLVGIFGHASMPIDGRDYGVETRIFSTGYNGMVAGAIMARVELGPKPKKKTPPRRPPPPPSEPPPPVYHPEPF